MRTSRVLEPSARCLLLPPAPATCFLFLRFYPTLFEMLFPVLRPRASEVVDEPGLARDEFRRPTIGPVDDRALHAALDKVKPPVRIAEPRPQLPRRHRVKRPRERLGI